MRTLLAVILLATPALADDWAHYSNARYGFSIDLPAKEWIAQPDPANGDGRAWHSADGKSGLMAWGNNIVDGSFRDDAEGGLSADRDAGWAISFRKDHNLDGHGPGPAWMAYSGALGGRILYVRSLANCGGTQAVHVRIEYPKDQQNLYGPMLTRITQSLATHESPGCP